MRTTYHRLPGDLTVELRGEGGRSIDEVRRMYERYAVPEPDGEPDVRCTMDDRTPNPTEVLGAPSQYFGREDDRFVIRSGGTFLSTDADWRDIRVSPNWEPFHLVYPLEFAVRERLSEAGRALVHGACVEFEGQTLLFPSWRGAGKTNTMFSLLTNGGNFLSDDRVWVDGEGNVWGHPMPTEPHTQQFDSFPALRKKNETPRDRVSNFIEANVDHTRSFPEKALVAFKNRVLTDIEREFRDITQVVPGTEWIPETDADAVVLLQAAPRNRHVDVDSVSPEDLSEDLRAIHDFEWNALLRKYFTTFDSLFPGQHRTKDLKQVIEAEERVFAELARTLPTFQADIPRENDWRSTGITDEVVEKLGRMELPDGGEAQTTSPKQA
jgi:hypothetical protein